MKVLVLANINSTHTKKWCLNLKKQGVRVVLFSLNPIGDSDDWYNELEHTYYPLKKTGKCSYWNLYKELKKLIESFQPDILHSHFATNYSFLGSISGFKNHVLTTWGSDVFVYPKKSFIGKQLLKYNLSKAKQVISTSHIMAKELAHYTKKKVEVIPFGVDFSLYKSRMRVLNSKPEIVLGCFKKTEPIYGTDVLIRALAIVKEKLNGKSIVLKIVGDGKNLEEYKALATQLDLDKNIQFMGWQNPNAVPAILDSVDICVYLSRNESFGVSLIEAMACKIPLVATKAPGFMEVLVNEQNGLLVDIEDHVGAANAILKLIGDDVLVGQITEHAYNHANNLYNIDKNIKTQIKLYERVLNERD